MENRTDLNSSQRKDDHIELAKKSIMEKSCADKRFHYEPLLSEHPAKDSSLLHTTFLGKKIEAPFWISSMTGGSEKAYSLNRVLAASANKFGIGMGLGSCRPLMESSDRFEDFNLRPILGDDLPFYANIGIAQLEQLNLNKTQANYFFGQLKDLDVDGLIIHVNPLQEWLQPEGDRFLLPPIETIKTLLEQRPNLKVVVKEVGQGFGPQSMKALGELPISGIEFGAFGGTNFSKLELMRGNGEQKELAHIGHTVEEMVEFYNEYFPREVDVIISGGLTNFLDGYYYQQTCKGPSVIGMAGEFLKHAVEGEDQLDSFLSSQIQGIKFALKYLTLNKKELRK